MTNTSEILNTINIKKYAPSDYQLWNNFVAQSKNGSFLFYRDFMEYHSNRFEDFSVLIFDANNNLLALLAANRADNRVYSHQGLTYGGFIFNKDLGGLMVGMVFEKVLSFFKNLQIKTFYLKQIPTIYHQLPSNEIEYFLFQKKAELIKREMNLAINYALPLKISKSKRKHFKKIEALQMVQNDNNFANFWNLVLIPKLSQKYNTKPVHTLSEIVALKKAFPNNILQYNAYYNNQIVAGITLFVNKNVVKSQYGATTSLGQNLRALDFLFIHLIEMFKDKADFFDMGTVNENDGYSFNSGLLKQKEELGCSIYCQDLYKISL